MAATISSGLLVFVAGEWEGHNLLRDFLKSPISIACLTLSTILVPVILYFINTSNAAFLRASIGLQVTLILFGWFAIQFPVIINVEGGQHLTFYNTHASDATLKQLLIALITGLVLVIPAFIFLFGVFKVKE